MSKYKAALPKLPERGWFKKGDNGEEVKKLQKALNWANGGTIKAPLKVDGIIGDLTVSAVSFFEEIHHLTIDGHFGSKCLATLKAFDLTGRWKAVNWAVSVAKDNRFTYGAGQRAHRCGCYFCKTNTGPYKKNKERKGEPHVVKDAKGNGHTYERTYCCNTYITAAYAHGAKAERVLMLCKTCGAMGMNPTDWTIRGFKKVGTCKDVPYEKLMVGDVIMSNAAKNDWQHHVWMYIGGGRFVEASGNNWSADSIASKPNAKTKYNSYRKHSGTYVVRYTK